ncbi:hypothetical protein [Massilia genomosp. 1]|uniref:Uncharacterized protein n=1 Tax=Massilia genomosp. 1 TaxID=2609280 RepID=A0ABX0MNT9_9BURK|nr:hypothetical protein [Massilia genomosp. 1]NHZ60907.1 hypothetical protein [Massilia genomosp. 1]
MSTAFFGVMIGAAAVAWYQYNKTKRSAAAAPAGTAAPASPASAGFAAALATAKAVYAADEGREPIRQTDYLKLLELFESLLGLTTTVPHALDTDLRRNLPGTGMDGIDASVDLRGRIGQARRFLDTHPATAAMGAGVLQNIDAGLGIVPAGAPLEALKSASLPLLASIGAKNIR